MNQVKSIRECLGLTQAALAEGIGCTQGNVGHYEKGQTVPPDAAARLIAFCRSQGLEIGFDHIYGSEALPDLRKQQGLSQPQEPSAPKTTPA